jgi:GNAT superfamily N-acetyltransferase
LSRLTVARDDQIDAVYCESHRLWGAGLSLRQYRELWDEMRSTPWGSRHARFCVWTNDRGELLSSLKVYRPRVRMHDRVARATVLGAVFTPAERRGRGHATAMVRAAIERARKMGDLAALLFSDIGTAFYADLGFEKLAAEEQSGRLPGIRGAARPGWTLRDMRGSDEEAVEAIHAESCARRQIAILRDAEHWKFLHVRAEGYFRRLGDRALRERRQVALRDGRVAGYLIAAEGSSEWDVREIGAAGGDPETLADVLRLGAGAARAIGLDAFHGWLPPELKPYLDPRQAATQARQRAVPMILPLQDAAPLAPSASATYMPYQDQF